MRVLAVLAASLAFASGCSTKACSADGTPVRHVTGAITIDGEIAERDWRDAALRTGPFKDPATGADAIPYSEARLLWDETKLYLMLYAGDEDIRAGTGPTPGAGDDEFEVRVSPAAGGDGCAFLINAAGKAYDAGGPGARRCAGGVQAVVDLDGTLNDPSDMDEEWVVEAAIPWTSVGIRGAKGSTFTVNLRRCDTPKGASTRCGTWRSAIPLRLAF